MWYTFQTTYLKIQTLIMKYKEIAQQYLGKEFQSNSCGKYTVIEYFDNKNTTVKFEDGTVLYNITTNRIRTGIIKNKNHPTLCGKGFEGYGKYSIVKDKKAGKIWNNIIRMCCNEKAQDRKSSYKELTVCEEWHNFQNFAEWFYENYDENAMSKWFLSRGILIKNSKLFSPETCCFAPQELIKHIKQEKTNRKEYPIGVSKQSTFFSSFGGKQVHGFHTAEEAFENYKVRKEASLKILAEEWKDRIPEKLYKALINYKVEITD